MGFVALIGKDKHERSVVYFLSRRKITCFYREEFFPCRWKLKASPPDSPPRGLFPRHLRATKEGLE